MAWYRSGTIALTNGSTGIVGSGTAWLSTVQAGHAINLPDGKVYEVLTVNSDTSITLGSSYGGATASGQTYSVQPNQGFSQFAAQILGALLATYSAYTATALAGKFGDGTPAAPGMSFVADQDSGLYRLGSNSIGICTAGVSRVLFDAAGNLGIGTTTPAAALHLASGYARLGTTRAYAGAVSHAFGGYGVTFQETGAAIGFNLFYGGAWRHAGDGTAALIQENAGQLLFYVAGANTQGHGAAAGLVATWGITPAGHFIPLVDNARTLGIAATRVAVVYAATGSINTSDARTKTVRGTLTAQELAAARDIGRAIRIFQFNDAIAEKGASNARWHTGVIAQEVIAIMEANGLIPLRYAFICHDQWDAVAALDGADAIEAGDRYAIRYDELAMFLAVAQEQRISAMEAKF